LIFPNYVGKQNLLRKVNRQNSQKSSLLFVTGNGKKGAAKLAVGELTFSTVAKL